MGCQDGSRYRPMRFFPTSSTKQSMGCPPCWLHAPDTRNAAGGRQPSNCRKCRSEGRLRNESKLAGKNEKHPCAGELQDTLQPLVPQRSFSRSIFPQQNGPVLSSAAAFFTTSSRNSLEFPILVRVFYKNHRFGTKTCLRWGLAWIVCVHSWGYSTVAATRGGSWPTPNYGEDTEWIVVLFSERPHSAAPLPPQPRWPHRSMRSNTEGRRTWLSHFPIFPMPMMRWPLSA